MSLGNCRLKQDTLCLLERRKSKTQTAPNVGKDVEQQELLLVADGMQNGRLTLEGSLAFSYKSKHTFTYDLAITFFNICSKQLKTYIHTKTCTYIYSSFVHNLPDLEVTKHPSIGERINKWLYHCLVIEYYSTLNNTKL